jgi:hypothetical protein
VNAKSLAPLFDFSRSAYDFLVDLSAGERDAESPGEEHAAGEHDLEDLEPRQEEEGGVPFRFRFVSYFSFVLALRFSVWWEGLVNYVFNCKPW